MVSTILLITILVSARIDYTSCITGLRLSIDTSENDTDVLDKLRDYLDLYVPILCIRNVNDNPLDNQNTRLSVQNYLEKIDLSYLLVVPADKCALTAACLYPDGAVRQYPSFFVTRFDKLLPGTTTDISKRGIKKLFSDICNYDLERIHRTLPSILEDAISSRGHDDEQATRSKKARTDGGDGSTSRTPVPLARQHQTSPRAVEGTSAITPALINDFKFELLDPRGQYSRRQWEPEAGRYGTGGIRPAVQTGIQRPAVTRPVRNEIDQTQNLLDGIGRQTDYRRSYESGSHLTPIQSGDLTPAFSGVRNTQRTESSSRSSSGSSSSSRNRQTLQLFPLTK